MAIGRLDMIQVQDVTTGTWFTYTWGTRTWNTAPHLSVGKPVYIAAYATNRGTNGNLTLSLHSASGAVLKILTQNVARYAGFGIEWNGTMAASGNTVFTVTVSP